MQKSKFKKLSVIFTLIVLALGIGGVTYGVTVGIQNYVRENKWERQNNAKILAIKNKYVQILAKAKESNYSYMVHEMDKLISEINKMINDTKLLRYINPSGSYFDFYENITKIHQEDLDNYIEHDKNTLEQKLQIVNQLEKWAHKQSKEYKAILLNSEFWTKIIDWKEHINNSSAKWAIIQTYFWYKLPDILVLYINNNEKLDVNIYSEVYQIVKSRNNINNAKGGSDIKNKLQKFLDIMESKTKLTSLTQSDFDEFISAALSYLELYKTSK
ncbi:hypothetical protein [Mycoplasma sp. 2634B]|uniref:hypothetical protein n=1 Tax=Mycoplasma sp. 2634B TaxID=3401692 RepID=UPI003AAE4FCE